MTKIPMDLDEECRVTGVYEHLGTWYGYPWEPKQRLNPPVPACENLKAYYAREDYEWVPDIHADLVDITPDCVPDIVACGFGGGLDAFGVRWIPDTSAPDLPAFVEPGLVTLGDISEWRSLPFPDVDTWGWEEAGRESREFYSGDDRLRRGNIMTGFFERLIALMGFEEAAISLIAEPEEVAAFFDALVDVYKRMIDRYVDDFGCGTIMVFDDWSAQKGPFFSLDVAMDLLVPPVRRLVDYAHGLSLPVTLHSCGNAVDLVPAMKATGVDAWQAQTDSFDLAHAVEVCGDDLIIEAYPTVPDDVNDDDLASFIAQVLSPAMRHRFVCEVHDFDSERCFKTRVEYYRQARTMAAEGRSV